MPLFVELVANDRPAIEQQDLCDGAYAMRQVGAACTGRRERSDEKGPDHPNGSWDIDPGALIPAPWMLPNRR